VVLNNIVIINTLIGELADRRAKKGERVIGGGGVMNKDWLG
jgi:hypothetical protein